MPVYYDVQKKGNLKDVNASQNGMTFFHAFALVFSFVYSQE